MFSVVLKRKFSSGSHESAVVFVLGSVQLGECLSCPRNELADTEVSFGFFFLDFFSYRRSAFFFSRAEINPRSAFALRQIRKQVNS